MSRSIRMITPLMNFSVGLFRSRVQLPRLKCRTNLASFDEFYSRFF